MKKVIIVAVVLLIGISSYSQKLKFGHVDTGEVFLAMPEREQASKAVEQFARQLEEQLVSLNKELEQKYNDYLEKVETFSPSIKQMREEDITNLQQRIQAFQMRAQQDLQAKEQELLEPIYNKITMAITEIGEQNGYLYIFDVSSLLFHSKESTDITEEVKAKLRK